MPLFVLPPFDYEEMSGRKTTYLQLIKRNFTCRLLLLPTTKTMFNFIGYSANLMEESADTEKERKTSINKIRISRV